MWPQLTALRRRPYTSVQKYGRIRSNSDLSLRSVLYWPSCLIQIRYVYFYCCCLISQQGWRKTEFVKNKWVSFFLYIFTPRFMTNRSYEQNLLKKISIQTAISMSVNFNFVIPCIIVQVKRNTNLMQHCAGFISAESLYTFRAQAPETCRVTLQK